MKARCNGIDLHYEIDGEGPTCLVLHGGLGIDHTLYRRSLQTLAEKFRLVFLDFRCNGRSERAPLESVTMEQLASDVVEFADALHFDNFILLGHSYGGFVAQEVAIRYPEPVRGLVLVATRAGAAGVAEDLTRYSLPPRPVGLVAMDGVDQTNVTLATKYWHDSAQYFTGPATINKLRDLLDETHYDGPVRMRGREILANWSTIDRLEQIKAPTLVIAGANDAVASPADGRRIVDHMKNATLKQIAGAHHWPWIERPDEFYDVVEEWVDQYLNL